MNPNSTPPKRSIWKKVLYIILIVIPILILLESGIGIIIGVKGINYISYLRLLNERTQITKLVINLLHLSVLEPGEKFYYLQSKSNLPLDMTVIAQDYPETIGIYRLNDDSTITNYLQHFPSVQIQDHILETAPMFLKELNFTNTYWDTNWTYSRQLVDIDNQSCLYTFLQTDTETYLLVTDLEKLKIRLPAIFEHWQKRLGVFAEHLLPFSEYGAQIKFFDKDGSNFFTLGTPQGTGWDDIWEHESIYLPWKMTIQIFPKNESLRLSASVKDKTPWAYIIKLILGVACIILLPWYAKR